MIKHAMDIIKKATQSLNPGQIPISTFDQPLYALAKFIQWKFPRTHGELVHVVMLDGLHIEMALWCMLGNLLNGSGWTTALTQSDVASAGTADSYLKCSRLMRTRSAHQVTIAALRKLQIDAFNLFNGPNNCDDPNFSAWRHEMSEKCPSFFY